jgi:hypothetical protein
MSSQSTRAAKSPLLAALGISLAIALGAVVGSADIGTIEDAITGKWLTRAFTETQDGHTVAIAALAHGLTAATREIDFVAARAEASIRRGEDSSFDRFAKLDAEIAALKDRIAGIQNTRLVPRTSEPVNLPSDVTGLRSSLHDLTTAHTSAVAALTRRLDRIEVKIGLSTDVTSSLGAPARRAARHANRPKVVEEGSADPAAASRGHIFNIKPISRQGTPLRLSRAPG